MVTQDALKEWLAELKNVCQVGITITPLISKRINDSYTKADLDIALELLAKEPPEKPIKAQTLFAMLDRAQYERRGGSQLPHRHDQPEEYTAMVSKYAQLVAIQGKPPPHEIPTIMLDCHRGAYDQLIRDHDDRIVFSGTKEFGDDWQACKKHHEALMAPLMDKSPGDDIRGLLQQLTGFNGIIKPLPYDKNVRSDGLTTPHDRMKYDNE